MSSSIERFPCALEPEPAPGKVTKEERKAADGVMVGLELSLCQSLADNEGLVFLSCPE